MEQFLVALIVGAVQGRFLDTDRFYVSCFVLRAMEYMTEQATLTSKKQTVAVPFEDKLSCILRYE